MSEVKKTPSVHINSQMQALWQGLAQRERRMVAAVGLLLLALLLWFVALGPAIKTWRTAAQEQAVLDGQLQRLSQMAEQAQVLAQAPSMGFDAAYRAFGRTTAEYLPGQAQVSLLGDEVKVQLTAAHAYALGPWLQALRHNAKALPLSAQLQAAAAEDGSGNVWTGELRFRLPPSD